MAVSHISCAGNFPQMIMSLRRPNTGTDCLAHRTTASVSNAQRITMSPKNFTDAFLERHEQKLTDVRKLLREKREDSLESLVMIDDLQRLCLDYHFEEEIQHVLHSQYDMSKRSSYNHQNDLYEVSTRFRLLRQQGYYVPTDVFNNFKDKKGRFKAELRSNIRGLLGLFEASHLSIEGEDILDRAVEFTAPLLKTLSTTSLDQNQARLVNNTLRFPHHKCISRLKFQDTVRDYTGQYGWSSVLQELAVMDYSLVQSTYLKEMLQLSKWGEEKGFANELEFARARPHKGYTCSVAELDNPMYSDERFELSKQIALVYILDDIYDVYGTVEQLVQFTEAVDKWDISATEQLPNYMKMCFKVLDDVINEFAYKVQKKHGWNATHSLRRTWAHMCNGFLVETKWLASGQLPKAEDYLKNGVITSGTQLVLVPLFFLMGDGINEETIDLLVNGYPDIITAPGTIGRLWDDIGNAKDENQDGRDGSYIDCYMKEHKGISAESARELNKCMISEAWKKLNKECLSPSSTYPATLRKGALDLARLFPRLYNYDENHNYDENRKISLIDEFKRSLLKL